MDNDDTERARLAFGLLPDCCTVLTKHPNGRTKARLTTIVCRLCLSNFGTMSKLLCKQGKIYERIVPPSLEHLDRHHGDDHIPSITSTPTLDTVSSLQTGGGNTELLVTGNGDEGDKEEEDQDQEGDNGDDEGNDEKESEINTDVDTLVTDFESIHSTMKGELAGLTPVCSDLVNGFNAAVDRLSAKKTYPLLWERETHMALDKVTRLKELLGALEIECSTTQASVGARLQKKVVVVDSV